jgi:hypothetical protein
VKEVADHETRLLLAALAAALTHEPGGIDAWCTKAVVAPTDVDARPALNEWGKRARRDGMGAWS